MKNLLVCMLRSPSVLSPMLASGEEAAITAFGDVSLGNSALKFRPGGPRPALPALCPVVDSLSIHRARLIETLPFLEFSLAHAIDVSHMPYFGLGPALPVVSSKYNANHDVSTLSFEASVLTDNELVWDA